MRKPCNHSSRRTGPSPLLLSCPTLQPSASPFPVHVQCQTLLSCFTLSNLPRGDAHQQWRRNKNSDADTLLSSHPLYNSDQTAPSHLHRLMPDDPISNAYLPSSSKLDLLGRSLTALVYSHLYHPSSVFLIERLTRNCRGEACGAVKLELTDGHPER